MKFIFSVVIILALASCSKEDGCIEDINSGIEIQTQFEDDRVIMLAITTDSVQNPIGIEMKRSKFLNRYTIEFLCIGGGLGGVFPEPNKATEEFSIHFDNHKIIYVKFKLNGQETKMEINTGGNPSLTVTQNGNVTLI